MMLSWLRGKQDDKVVAVTRIVQNSYEQSLYTALFTNTANPRRSGERVDLMDISCLDGIGLEGMALSRIKLAAGTSVRNANLKSVQLSGAIYPGADFSGSDFEGASVYICEDALSAKFLGCKNIDTVNFMYDGSSHIDGITIDERTGYLVAKPGSKAESIIRKVDNLPADYPICPAQRIVGMRVSHS